MNTLKQRLAIFAILGILVLTLSATTFAQGSKRTLIDDSTAGSANSEKTDSADKKDSNAASSENPSNQKPQSIVGSGLSQPQTQAAKSAWPPQQPSGSYELFYKPIGATFLICALAIGFTKLYRKYGRKGNGADAPIATVMASLPLGDKRSLAVVKVGREVLVLGNTPNSITLLAQLKEDFQTAPETKPVVSTKQRTQPVQPIEDFTRHLKEEMDRKAQTRGTEEPQFARVRQSLLGL